MNWINVDTILRQQPEAAIGNAVIVKGWVRSRRDSKAGLSFIALSDGSCFGVLQVVAPAELSNYEADVKRLSVGCSIEVEIYAIFSFGNLSRPVKTESTLFLECSF